MIAHRISMSENVLFRGGLYNYGPPEVFSVLQSDKYYKQRVKESERAREKREKIVREEQFISDIQVAMTNRSSSSLEASLQSSARTGGLGLVCLCRGLSSLAPLVVVVVVMSVGAVCEVPSREVGEEWAWCGGDLPFLSDATWVVSPPHSCPKLDRQGGAPFGAWVVTTTGAIEAATAAATGGLADRVKTGVDSAMAHRAGLVDGPCPGPTEASRLADLSGEAEG